MTARLILAALAAACATTAAGAQSFESYVSFSAGATFLDDSEESGFIAQSFTSGDGGVIPAGTVFDAGTPLGWTTEFDDGYALSAALGAATASGWRGEIELAYASNDIAGHAQPSLDGTAVGGANATLLLPGVAAQGVTLDSFLAIDDGSLEATYLMANAYYDFGRGEWRVTPYVGAGIGWAFVDVDYSPQSVSLVQDEDNVFAYQAIGGASFAVSDRIDLFAQARYRASEDVKVRGGAAGVGIPLAFDLEVENKGYLADAGLRLKF